MNRTQIQEIYKKFAVGKEVILHMRKVAYVCNLLSKKLQKKGIKINKQLVINSALLHDVLRVADIKTENFEDFCEKNNADKKTIKKWQSLRKKYKSQSHEKAMSNYLKTIKEKQIAKAIENHGYFRIDKLRNWEEKILYYADKRVDYNKIVSIKDRLEKGRKRNLTKKTNLAKIKVTDKKIYQLEKEIIEILEKMPKDLI